LKITFFGTSHGVPEIGRRCSSALVTVGENNYFVDMGMQSVEELVNRGIPVESVKAVFITHLHGDHVDGLFSFVDLCSWYYRTASPVVFLPTDGSIQAMKAWFAATEDPLRADFRFDTVSEGAFFDDGCLKVTAARTKHCGLSYAFLLEAEGKRVLFAGDESGKGPTDDFPLAFGREKAIDFAVCECAHYDATAYLPIIAEANIGKMGITHVYPARADSIRVLAETVAPLPVWAIAEGEEVTV